MKFVGVALVLVGVALIYFIYSTAVNPNQSYTQTVVEDVKKFLQGNTSGSAVDAGTPTSPSEATGSTGTTILSPGTAPSMPTVALS